PSPPTSAAAAAQAIWPAFVEPRRLHLEPAGLPERLGLPGPGGGRPAAVAEELVGPGERLPLPGVGQGRGGPPLACPLPYPPLAPWGAARAASALNAAGCCFRLPATVPLSRAAGVAWPVA